MRAIWETEGGGPPKRGVSQTSFPNERARAPQRAQTARQTTQATMSKRSREEEDECPVCMEPYDHDAVLRSNVFSCNHSMCTACYVATRRCNKSATCPLCRAEPKRIPISTLLHVATRCREGTCNHPSKHPRCGDTREVLARMDLHARVCTLRVCKICLLHKSLSRLRDHSFDRIPLVP